MATILEFRVSDDAGARSEMPVKGTLGEIIIFPGVRIERYDTASEEMPAHNAGVESPAGAWTKSQA